VRLPRRRRAECLRDFRHGTSAGARPEQRQSSPGGRFHKALRNDPASGYVAIRSIVTDEHGDKTEQPVYRAYAVTG